MRTNTALSVITAALLAFTVQAAIFRGPFVAKSALASSALLRARRSAESERDGAAQTASGHTYGAFWEVGGGYSSTLYLRNKDTQSLIKATVVQYSSGGGVLEQTPLQVAAGSVTRLALGAGAGYSATGSVAWGGLMIEIPGFSAVEALGEVVVENYQTGVIFDLPLLGGYRYDRQEALYAPWWLPDSGTDGTVTLFNITGQSIMVTPSITTQGIEQSGEPFSLGPLESQQMSLRSLMAELRVSPASEGFLTLRYTGPPHALDPSLMLANPSNGFSLVPGFNARLQAAGTAETNWQFPAVFLEGDSTLGFAPNQTLTAYALVSNGTSTALSPQVTAYVTGSGADAGTGVSLPVEPLAPLETRLINLSAMATSGVLAEASSRFALSVEHSGNPGTMAVTIFSVGQTGNFVLPSNGTVHPSVKMDSTYWNISDGLQSMLTMYNPGPSVVDATAILTYQTGDGVESYTLPPVSLPANGSQALNLGQIVASGAPDPSGGVIPPGVTFGTLTLQTGGGATGNGNLVVGGCTSFDPVRGGYGDTIEPDCELCDPDDEDDCETCVVDEDGDSVCEPDCGDPSCCTAAAAAPEIMSIDPAKGAVGITYSLTITGTGFASGAKVNVDQAGSGTSGITAENITVASSTQIFVDFNIAQNASPGNHSVTVTVSGQTSDPPVNFFVQVPTRVTVDSPGNPGTVVVIDPGPGNIVTANGETPNGGSNVCGAYENVTYQLADQKGNPIEAAGTSMEVVTQVGGTDSTLTTGSGTINDAGQLADTLAIFKPMGKGCPAVGDSITDNHMFSVTLTGQSMPYTLTTVQKVVLTKTSGGSPPSYSFTITTTTP
ncbi:MAG TPA: IPT/TIG domain-containing protein [Blastocatellia bacterium]